MSEVKIKEISPSRRVGTRPHWIERNQSLLYVDITSGNIHRYFPKTDKTQTLHVGDSDTTSSVSFVVPVEDENDIFAIGVGSTLSLVQFPEEGLDYQQTKPYRLLTVDKHVESTRFNDAKCDPSGRLWAGTTDDAYGTKIIEKKGSLYRIGQNLDSARVVEEVSISNGMTWSNDQTVFYYIDTLTRKIDAFNYDLTSGNISNRRTVLDLEKHKVGGVPDGMTIDVNGKLWVACFGSAQILNIDPAVEKIERILKFPSLQTTSCCWGGSDYSTLFVTSANLDLKPEELEKYPSSGKTFAVIGLGTKGLPPNEFRLKKDYAAQYLKQ